MIITGLSGAGKTEAIKAFEDLGYFCIDNFPAILVNRLSDMMTGTSTNVLRVALVIDARGEDFFTEDLALKFQELMKSGYVEEVLFLEASDEALVRRFKESRRPHPLASSGGIVEALKRERALLSKVRAIATEVVDTTNMTTRELKAKINDRFGDSNSKPKIAVDVVSFGFKNGAPIDADLVFDVRFLPNPYYVEELRCLTGESVEVRKYIFGYSVTTEFLKRFFALLKFLMEQYVKEGKQSLVIGIGCTGGKHRSVAIASRTVEFLRDLGYKAVATHRDINLVDKINDICEEELGVN